VNVREAMKSLITLEMDTIKRQN